MAPLNGKAKVTAREIDLFSGLVGDLSAVHDFSFTTRLDIGADTITVTPLVSF